MLKNKQKSDIIEKFAKNVQDFQENFQELSKPHSNPFQFPQNSTKPHKIPIIPTTHKNSIKFHQIQIKFNPKRTNRGKPPQNKGLSIRCRGRDGEKNTYWPLLRGYWSQPQSDLSSGHQLWRNCLRSSTLIGKGGRGREKFENAENKECDFGRKMVIVFGL
jgi:hypothetical protein